MMKTWAMSLGLTTLMSIACLPTAYAQNEGEYVSREEYEKLKRDFERMKAMLEQMEKRLASQPKEGASRQEVAKVKKELKQVKKEAAEAKKQARVSMPGMRKFLLTGYGFAGFSSSERNDSSFNVGFNPIFLWKLNDQIFFEGEAEFELEDGETNVSLEFAQLSYLFNDYLTFGAGKFLNPTNYFIERLHPAWINKLPDQPLSISDDNRIQAKAVLGAQVRGAVPLRLVGLKGGRVGYALYVANGPEMNDDGSLDFKNYDGFNSSKTVGGRIGLVPLPGFEVGYGFEVGRARDPYNANKLDFTTHVIDANYVHIYRAIRGRIDMRAQWAWRNLDNSSGLGFDNKVSGGYGQIAYRPSLAQLKWIKDLEGVFRFDRLNQPNSSSFYDENRYTVGMNYYFNPTTLFKFAYEFDDRRGAKDNDTLLFQLATGF